jgi:hypothetical protein
MPIGVARVMLAAMKRGETRKRTERAPMISNRSGGRLERMEEDRGRIEGGRSGEDGGRMGGGWRKEGGKGTY